MLRFEFNTNGCISPVVCIEAQQLWKVCRNTKTDNLAFPLPQEGTFRIFCDLPEELLRLPAWVRIKGMDRYLLKISEELPIDKFRDLFNVLF